MEAKATILVADDEPNIRLLLEDELRDAGYRVITAENGAQAVGLAEDQKPDLIVLDIKMPEMNGIEATKWLRHVSKSTPIVVYSAFAGLPELFSEVKDSIAAFLSKPVNLARLRETVDGLLAGRPA